MKGIWTDAITMVTSNIELGYEIIETKDKEKIFRLHGGPTGYESFYITDDKVKSMSEHGWKACMGSPGAWSSLFIPAKEMKEVFKECNLQMKQEN